MMGAPCNTLFMRCLEYLADSDSDLLAYLTNFACLFGSFFVCMIVCLLCFILFVLFCLFVRLLFVLF